MSGKIDISDWKLGQDIDFCDLINTEVLEKLVTEMAQEAMECCLRDGDSYISLPFEWGDGCEPTMIQYHFRLGPSEDGVVFQYSLNEEIDNILDSHLLGSKEIDPKVKPTLLAIAEGFKGLADKIKVACREVV